MQSAQVAEEDSVSVYTVRIIKMLAEARAIPP